MENLGVTAAARVLGISHVALLKAEKTGRVTREADGKFDVEKCRVDLKRNSHPERSRQARSQQKGRTLAVEHPSADPESSTDTTAEAVRQETWEKVRQRRLENDLKEAALVELAPINAFVAGLIIKARDEMVRIGPELRDKLAQETDPIRCEELVADRVRQALSSMKEYRPSGRPI